MIKSFALAILATLANAQSSGTVTSVTDNADGTTQTVVVTLDDGTTDSKADWPIDIAVAVDDTISEAADGAISVNGVEVIPASADTADSSSGDVTADSADGNLIVTDPVTTPEFITYYFLTDWQTTGGAVSYTHLTLPTISRV